MQGNEALRTGRITACTGRVTRRLAPGSPALATQPGNVYLPERAVLPALNAWIGELFDRHNVDQAVAAPAARRCVG